MSGSIDRILSDGQVLLERCVNAHLFLEPSLWETSLCSKLSASDFADDSQRVIFETLKSVMPCNKEDIISRLYEKNSMIMMHLSEMPFLDRDFLSFEKAVDKLHDCFVKNKLMTKMTRVYGEIVSSYKKMSTEDILAELKKVVEGSENDYKDEDVKKYSEVLDGYVDTLEQRKINYDQGVFPGIPTGIKELNESIYGWCPGKYYIVAARTSMGKTTLAVNFADAALYHGKKVLMFTNEMGAEEIAEKHLSLRAKVKGPDLYRGSISDEEIARLSVGIGQVKDYDFFISEESGRDLEKFTSVVKRYKRKHDVDLVILDYVQQMNDDSSKHETRLRELTHISNTMKMLARSLKIPIICLAQLNRTADRSDDAPSISQIKDCGAFEQDADCVIMINRDKNSAPNSLGEVPGKLIIGKARQGKTGEVGIMINFAHNKFR